MEGNYYSDGVNRFYRVYASEKNQGLYEVGMINHNQPELLLRLHLTQEGDRPCFDYHVSGLQALSECQAEDLQGDYLYSIVFSLAYAAEIVESYLLSPEDLVLSPDQIFLRRESGQVFFLYYPGQEGTLQEHLLNLMEHFMKVLNPTEEDEVLLLYGLYQKARESNVTLTTLSEYWQSMRGKQPFSKAADPVETDLPAEEETDPVYEELGLQPAAHGRAYSKWRQERVIERDSVPMETVDLPCEIVGRQEKEKRGGELIGQIKEKVKAYAMEIGIGTVVVTGALLILLT